MASVTDLLKQNNALSGMLTQMPTLNSNIQVEIPISQIQETDDNEFIFGYDEGEIRRLANEIEEGGFVGTIDVVRKGVNQYQVFSGHQRLRAMKLLGRKTIPCTVTEDMPDDELYRKLLASNILVRKLNPLSYSRAIEEYDHKVLQVKKPRGSKRTLIAEFFGISTGMVSIYQAIAKMPVGLQEKCADPDFPFSSLQHAVTLTDKQKEILLNQINQYEATHKLDPISAKTLTGMIEAIKLTDDPSLTDEQNRYLLNCIEQFNVDKPSSVLTVDVVGKFIEKIKAEAEYDHAPGVLEEQYEVRTKTTPDIIRQKQEESYRKYKTELKENILSDTSEMAVVDDVVKAASESIFKAINQEHYMVLNNEVVRNSIRLLEESIRQLKNSMTK